MDVGTIIGVVFVTVRVVMLAAIVYFAIVEVLRGRHRK